MPRLPRRRGARNHKTGSERAKLGVAPTERPSFEQREDASPKSEIADELVMERFPNRVVVRLRGGPSCMTDETRTKLREGSALPRNADGPITDRPTRTVEGTVVDAGDLRPARGLGDR